VVTLKYLFYQMDGFSEAGIVLWLNSHANVHMQGAAESRKVDFRTKRPDHAAFLQAFHAFRYSRGRKPQLAAEFREA